MLILLRIIAVILAIRVIAEVIWAPRFLFHNGTLIIFYNGRRDRKVLQFKIIS